MQLESAGEVKGKNRKMIRAVINKIYEMREES